MWLNALRELQEVCAEYGLEALKDYREYFESYMSVNNGIAPIEVYSPKSLTNAIAGHVAKMRNRPPKQEAITFEIEEREYDSFCIWTDLLGTWKDSSGIIRERRSRFCHKPVVGEYGKYCAEHKEMAENEAL